VEFIPQYAGIALTVPGISSIKISQDLFGNGTMEIRIDNVGDDFNIG
jgi:uncharacterized phage protein gp47/JayE